MLFKHIFWHSTINMRQNLCLRSRYVGGGPPVKVVVKEKKKYLFFACMWSVFKEMEYLDKCPSAQNLVAGADSSKTAGVHTNKLH